MKKASKKIKKICVVFVCTGNTCRSPVAERILKHRMKQSGKSVRFRVLSAGLSAGVGDGMSPLSAGVLRGAGMPYQNHKSRPVTDKLVRGADVFICMTDGHKYAMQGLRHPHVYSIAEITGGMDVCDPYGGTEDDYRRMFDYLLYAMPEVEAFIEKRFPAERVEKERTNDYNRK